MDDRRNEEGESDCVMEKTLIRDIVRQIKMLRKEIKVDGLSDTSGLLREIMQECPELQYYIVRLRYTRTGESLTINIKYRNIEYPFSNIIVEDIPDINRILVDAVSGFRTKIVLAAPKDSNIGWRIDYFAEKDIYCFPQVKRIRRINYGWEEIPYAVSEIRLEYFMESGRLMEMDLKTEKEAHRIVKQLFPIDMPESAKCYIAHNYLASTVRYRKPAPDDPVQFTRAHSAYGALIDKISVCQGFAHAYRMILQIAGIACDIVAGQATSKTRGAHAWNIIHFSSGKYVHVDVTWDAGRKNVSHKYCFSSDVSISYDHEWDMHYYHSCINGESILEEARSFCSIHREELLREGLEPIWID